MPETKVIAPPPLPFYIHDWDSHPQRRCNPLYLRSAIATRPLELQGPFQRPQEDGLMCRLGIGLPIQNYRYRDESSRDKQGPHRYLSDNGKLETCPIYARIPALRRFQISSCEPSSTTRLVGSLKKAIGLSAFRTIQAKSRSRQIAIPGREDGTSVSRLRK